MFNGQLRIWRDGKIIRGQLTVQTRNKGPITVDVASPIRKKFAQINGIIPAKKEAATKVKDDLMNVAKYWPETSLVHPSLVAYSRRLFIDLNSTSSKARSRALAKVEKLREYVEKNSGSAADILYCLSRSAEKELRRREGARMLLEGSPITIGFDYKEAQHNLNDSLIEVDKFVKRIGPKAFAQKHPTAFGAWLYAKRRSEGKSQKAAISRLAKYEKAHPGVLKKTKPHLYGMLTAATKLSEIAKEQRMQVMAGGPITLVLGREAWNTIAGAVIIGSIWTDIGKVASKAGDALKSVTNVAASPFMQQIKDYLPILDAALPGLGTGLKVAVSVAPMVKNGMDAIQKAKAGDKKAIQDIKTVKQLAAAGVPEAKQTLAVLQVSQEVLKKTTAAAEKEIGVVPSKSKPTASGLSFYDAGTGKTGESIYRKGLFLGQ